MPSKPEPNKNPRGTDKREIDAGRARMFRRTYLDWGKQKIGMEFADEAQEDDFVELI